MIKPRKIALEIAIETDACLVSFEHLRNFSPRQVVHMKRCCVCVLCASVSERERACTMCPLFSLGHLLCFWWGFISIVSLSALLTCYKVPSFHTFIFAVVRIKALIRHLFTWESACLCISLQHLFSLNIYTESGKVSTLLKLKKKITWMIMWNHIKLGTEWHDPCCYSLFTFN